MAIGNPITLTNNVATKTISVTATADQTLFTVTGGYRINQLAVFRNGVRLADGADFTARDGSSVTLLTPANLGDNLEFQVFDDFRVADAIATAAASQTINGDLTVTGNLLGASIGIGTASTNLGFNGFSYLGAPFGATVNFAVTVAAKTAAHRYNGSGSSNGYLIDGVESPFLTLTPGRTYRFTLSSGDMTSHPFRFYLEADKTTAYTTNVTSTATYTEIVVTDSTPQVLHYQCSAHGYMGNAVQTNSNIASVATNASGLTGTPDIAIRNITGVAATFTGVVTYEDVTNIDSVGIITARTGVRVNAGGLVVTAGVSTLAADLSIADKIVHTGDTNTAIRFPAADTFSVETSGSEALRIDSSGRLLVGTNSAFDGGTSTLLQVESTGGARIALSRNDTTTATNDSIGRIRWYGNDSDGGYDECARIEVIANADHASNSKPSALTFHTTASSAESSTERLRIDSSGRLLLGTTTAYGSSDNFVVQKTDGGARIGLQRSDTGQVTAGEELGAITFYSNDGDLNPSAQISSQADLAHAVNDKPGRLTFSTTADNDTAPIERLRITSAGLVRVPDNGKFTAGAGDDLQIYHNGSQNLILSAAGQVLETRADTFQVTNSGGTENLLQAIGDGAVNLYHNGTKKFETTTSGVTVTGTVSDSIGPLRKLGTNTQSGNYTLVASDLGKMVVRTGGNITISDIGTSSAGDMITIMNNAASDMQIISSSFTLYNTSDASTTSPKTLAARGVATLVFIATNVAYISGGGLS